MSDDGIQIKTLAELKREKVRNDKNIYVATYNPFSYAREDAAHIFTYRISVKKHKDT